MLIRSLTGGAALAALLFAAVASHADDAKKYPDIAGVWNRGSPAGSWDPSKPPGRGQQAPLTPEYQKVFEENQAKRKAGMVYDLKAGCGPVGMPRIMVVYEPIEIVIMPHAVYMLAESTSPVRRIFTDGRDWPKNMEPSYLGYSIGHWVDDDNDGTYDALEIETRYIGGQRLFDGSGTPLANDNSTVVKERLYLDKANPNIIHNDITTIDHALTRPWTVSRFYRREHGKAFEEYNCMEDNRWVSIGGRVYMTDDDGYLMPIVKGEPAPDPKYFRKHFGGS